MFLNILNGPYPGLRQQNKTLPMAPGETGIVRGSLLKDVDGFFEVAQAADAGDTKTPGAFIYLSLIPQTCLTAGMAGNMQGVVNRTGDSPVLTAMPVTPDMTIETDMFEGDLIPGDYVSVGNNGIFVAHKTGETAIGIVDKAVQGRYLNNAPAVAGRTGAAIKYIVLTTKFIPSLVTA